MSQAYSHPRKEGMKEEIKEVLYYQNVLSWLNLKKGESKNEMQKPYRMHAKNKKSKQFLEQHTDKDKYI